MRIPLARFAVFVLAQIITAGFALGQVMTHGPVVGSVTASSAKVFVRTDQAATIVLRYGTDPDLGSYITSDSFQTDATSDFTKIIPLDSLATETPYYLNVMVNGVPQNLAPYPTFATFAPPSSSRDFKFIVLADFVTVDKLTQSFQTFASAAAELPAFVFIGGDFDHRNPATLSDKRKMFRELYSPATPFMTDFVSTILRRYAIARQWDDHDSGLNNLDKNYPDWAVTQQVFQEYVPLYPLPLVTPGIWQSFSYAQADFFVLDCRSQRDPGLDPDGPDKSMLDGNNLGATGELEWLKNGLLTSTARWKIIFTSVVTNSTTKVNDAWGAYPTEWNALKSFITTNNIQDVVFIAGDLHLAAIDNGSISGFPEMCVPQPNADRTGSCATGARGTWSEGYYDDTCAGYGLVTVSQNPDRLILQTADQFGQIHLSYTVMAAGSSTPPTITTQPADRTVREGQRARFSVTATGTPPLHYQWMKNGVNITGATKASYTTPPTTAADNGALFAVTVSNLAGSETSNNAILTVQ
jgi:alkaline phosphatase D